MPPRVMPPAGAAPLSPRAADALIGPGRADRQLASQLETLGVRRGGILMVHASFSAVGRLRGGPDALIAAIEEILGPEGTLCMPSHSYAHEDPAVFVVPPPPEELASKLRALVLPYEPSVSPTTGMGVVAECFRQQPGTIRSGCPFAVAARGPMAAYIAGGQQLFDQQGVESPVGRLYELGASALLIGVGLNRHTCMHVAEAIAATPWRLRCRTRTPAGWVAYEARLNCGNSFGRIEPQLRAAGVVREGPVGRADAMLIPVRDSVDLAAAALRANPGFFLCSPGGCPACDRARRLAAAG